MSRILLSFLFFLFALASRAQFQIGISGGLANYQGDLTDRAFVGPLNRGQFGLHLKYELSQRIVLRGSGTIGKIAGNDAYLSKDYLRARNLSFESVIAEASGVVEVHTFRLDEKRWSPYVFGGLALFRFNPYAYDYAGRKHFLKGLSTEGQGLPGYSNVKPYSLIQWSIPFGGGFRYNLTDKVLLGAEFGLRKLFTDYLDDVSTNYPDAADLLQYRGGYAVDMSYRADELPGGNPDFPAKGEQRGGAKQKDYYYFTSLTLSFRLGQGGRFGSDSRKSGYGCPVVF